MPPILQGTADGRMKMDHRDARLKEILERFGDVPVSQEPSVQQLKRILDDFLENGPGTLEERQQVLIDRLLEMDASHEDFLSRRN
jgi:hypothetical protein